MSQPFIYIGTYKLKEGQLETFKESCHAIVDMVEANEPKVIAFNFYYDEDTNEVSCVQVHPDADSMVFHMKLLSKHVAAVLGEDSPIDVVTTNHIFGTPSETVLEMIEEWDPGVPLIVKPNSLAGLTRSAAE
jgi:hypothetical protein